MVAAPLPRAGRLVAKLVQDECIIVTDHRLVEAGIVDSVTVPLAAAGIDAPCFEDGEPEPTLEAAERTIARARDVHPTPCWAWGGAATWIWPRSRPR